MSSRHDRTGAGSILVVDDDQHLRVAVARILAHEGHDVSTAHDGPTAVAMTKEHRPDLLVLDYMMPGMDGEMVIAALRAELEQEAPPALLLTASHEPGALAKRMGAVVGLAKPFAIPELIAAVERHRRRERAS